ncbi:MAG: glycosyltransferase family 92 protein [Rhizobiales bacterium]|nr:glycosyltransferase family 92 protein [Hyphomicrobiales bacterium]
MSFWTLKNAALRLRKTAARRLADMFNDRTLAARTLPPIAKGDGRDGRIALVAIMKDEQDYVAEWLEFYILQGVSKFVIYDNGSTDRTVDIVKSYARHVDCTVIPWRTFIGRDGNAFSLQALAYAHALTNFGHDVRWMAFLDVDEFLFATSGELLVTAMTEFADLPSLSIPWTNFGPNGHAAKPEGLVIENYTECTPHPMQQSQRSLVRYKSIVDPSEVSGMGTHHFPLIGHGLVMFNEKRVRVSTSNAHNPSVVVTGKLQLNHYFTRSVEEMQARIAKGRISRNGKKVENYIDRRLKAYQVHTAQEEKILQFLPALKEQMRDRALRRA